MGDRLVIEVEVDAKGVEKGVAVAKASAERLARAIVKLEEYRVATTERLRGRLSAADRQSAQNAMNHFNRQLANFQRGYTRMVQIAQQGEAQIARARQKAAQDEEKKAKAGGGFNPIDFAKYAIAAGAGVVGKAVKDQLDLAAALREVQRESGATRDQAAQLAGQLQVLGVPLDDLSTGFRTLAQQTQNTPEQFAALGIALTDSEGKARSVFDIFMDVRRVLAESSGDAATLTVAQELLGRSYQQLLPFLNATEEELRAISQAALDAGIIMSGPAQVAAEQLANAQVGLQVALQSVAQTIAQNVIPMLAEMTEHAAVAIDTLAALANTPHANVSQGTPFFSGLANVLGGAWDALTGNPTEQLRKVNAQVNAQETARKAIADIMNRQRAALGNPRAGPSLGGATQQALAANKAASQEALRAELDAMREAAAERIETLQVHLKAFTKQREAAIEAIEDEADARRKAHDDALESISAEMEELDDAYRTRERHRDDEIDSLRDVEDAEERILDLEERRASLADAEADLALERSVEVFRGAGQSAEDYRKAVFDQNRRIKDAEKRLADEKKTIVRDEARYQIEQRIKAIEEERKADQRLMEDKREQAEERMSAIRKQAELESETSRDRIEALRKEISTERERVSEAIDSIQKETAAAVKGIEAVIAALNAIPRNVHTTITTTHVGVGGGTIVGGGGTNAGPITVGPGSQEPIGGGSGETLGAAEAETFIRQAYRDLLHRALTADETPGAWTGRIGQNKQSILSSIFNSQEARNIREKGGGTTRDAHDHDYPHSMRLAEPTVMIGKQTGRNYGTIAATGPEEVSFAGVGTGRIAATLPLAAGGGGRDDGGAPIRIYMDVDGMGVAEGARLIARENARALGRRAGRGYGRRR